MHNIPLLKIAMPLANVSVYRRGNRPIYSQNYKRIDK